MPLSSRLLDFLRLTFFGARSQNQSRPGPQSGPCAPATCMACSRASRSPDLDPPKKDMESWTAKKTCVLAHAALQLRQKMEYTLERKERGLVSRFIRRGAKIGLASPIRLLSRRWKCDENSGSLHTAICQDLGLTFAAQAQLRLVGVGALWLAPSKKA